MSESISFTDSISKISPQNLDESVSFTDSISKTAPQNLDESISFTDSISRFKGDGINLDESISFTDFVGKTAHLEMPFLLCQILFLQMYECKFKENK